MLPWRLPIVQDFKWSHSLFTTDNVKGRVPICLKIALFSPLFSSTLLPLILGPVTHPVPTL